MDDQCLYCRGRLAASKVKRMQEFEGRWYLIENVPALVCGQCGEKYYSMDANDMVLRLVSNPANPVRVEQVVILEAKPYGTRF